MRKIIGALIVTSLILITNYSSGYTSENTSNLSWFDSNTEITVEQKQTNTKTPYKNYWNIPCIKVDGSCKQRVDLGYLESPAKIRPVGAEGVYELRRMGGSITVTDFISRIPNSDDVLIFDTYVRIYRDFARNIKPIFWTSGVNVGKLRYFEMTNDFYSTDQRVKYSDGANVTNLKANGFSFSENGKVVVVNNGAYQTFINIETGEARRFGGNSVYPGYVTSKMMTALNSTGDVVLTMSPDFSAYTLYNLSDCVSAGGIKPEICEKRELKGLLQQKIPGFSQITYARFATDSSLELFVKVVRDGETFTDRYLVMLPGAKNFGMKYLALGDSFASGEGAHNYKPYTDIETNMCHLSHDSYPYLIQGELNGGVVESIACSGAMLKDVFVPNAGDSEYKDHKPQGKGKNDGEYNNEIFNNFLAGYRWQLDFIERKKPEIITISIVGNDVGFGRRLEECVKPGDCYEGSVERAGILKEITSQFDRLVETYQAIKDASPFSRIYVMGYPQIAKKDGECALNVLLSPNELATAEAIINDINAMVELAAQKTGAYYIDVTDAFYGKRLCEDKSSVLAMNGVTAGRDVKLTIPYTGIGARVIGKESYHPNKQGHRMYKTMILDQTENLTRLMPDPDEETSINQLQSKLIEGDGSVNLEVVPRPILNDDVAQDVQTSGDRLASSIALQNVVLKPGSTFQVEIHSNPQVIGVATAASMSELDIDAVVPDGVEPGMHTIHILGQDVSGKPIDIYKTVMVIYSNEDFDGDGIVNEEDTCQFIEPSGQDYDEDGIDDACDGFIDEVPQGEAPQVEDAQNTNKPEIHTLPQDSMIDNNRISEGQTESSGHGVLQASVQPRLLAMSDLFLEPTQNIIAATQNSRYLNGSGQGLTTKIAQPKAPKNVEDASRQKSRQGTTGHSIVILLTTGIALTLGLAARRFAR